jgi:hypothetical protein
VAVLIGRCHEWFATSHTDAPASGLEVSWQIRARRRWPTAMRKLLRRLIIRTSGSGHPRLRP